jgi:hypothetical protein
MTADPKIIMSRHNGLFTRDGITVEVNICRLEHTKWSLEVVDKDDNSIVWDGEFETEDEAYAEFVKSVETEGLDGVIRDPARLH